MDRIWQWAWDRYGARYSWAALAVAFSFSLPIYLFWSFLIVAVEKSGHYVQAAAVTVVAALVSHCVGALTNRWFRPAQQWAAGHEVDRATALEATYTFTRRAVPRALWSAAVWFALLSVIVGAIAGASGGVAGAAVSSRADSAARYAAIQRAVSDTFEINGSGIAHSSPEQGHPQRHRAHPRQ